MFYRLRCVNAHDQQKRFEWYCNGYFDEIVQSYDSQKIVNEKVADVWRDNGVCQRIGNILDNENPREHVSSIIAWKALRWKRVFLRMDQWSKTTSHQKRDSNTLQYGKLRSYRGSWLDKFFLDILIILTDAKETGESLFFIFFIPHHLHLQ